MMSNAVLKDKCNKGGMQSAVLMAELLLHEIFPPEALPSGMRCLGLNVIAIGASTIAASRVDKELQDYSVTDDVLKPRVFEVRKYRHADGEQIRRVRLIGEGLNALDDAKYHSDYLSILESRWAS